MNEAFKKQFKAKGMSETDATAAAMKPKTSDGFVDMKRSKKDKKEMSVPSQSYDDYPYGLRIDLDDEMMKKLGMDMPTVGDTVTITAKAKVERAELRDSGDGKKQSCCVQIQKMKVS